jgi:hypothetical protein
VVTGISIAPFNSWVRLTGGSNFIKFNRVMLSVVGDVSSTARQRDVYDNFVNLKDLSEKISHKLSGT